MSLNIEHQLLWDWVWYALITNSKWWWSLFVNFDRLAVQQENWLKTQYFMMWSYKNAIYGGITLLSSLVFAVVFSSYWVDFYWIMHSRIASLLTFTCFHNNEDQITLNICNFTKYITVSCRDFFVFKLTLFDNGKKKKATCPILVQSDNC